MRLTKAIRDYVEEEIYKKYNDAANEIGKEYYEAKQHAQEMVEEIMKEASDKASQYLKDLGYEVSPGYRGDSIFVMNGSFLKKDEREINNKRQELRSKARAKARQVLFDLEMGDTNKKELRDVLDSIVID